jgi:16S rRNA (guanine527-N7)-methyltransferase
MPTPDQDQKLARLVDLFLEQNAITNLSAFRTPEHVRVGNVLDSIAFLDSAAEILGKDWHEQKLMLLDLGTGGGFPLLPLAITMPNAQLVGLDAVRKKVTAVNAMAASLELKNVEVVCGRAEDFARHPDVRAKFDIVTARAVAPLNVLLEYAVPFLKVGGVAVFWKSTHIADELRQSLSASTILHAKLSGNYTYTLPGDWGDRTILVFKKHEPTSDEYPRRNGLPKIKPL